MTPGRMLSKKMIVTHYAMHFRTRDIQLACNHWNNIGRNKADFFLYRVQYWQHGTRHGFALTDERFHLGRIVYWC